MLKGPAAAVTFKADEVWRVVLSGVKCALLVVNYSCEMRFVSLLVVNSGLWKAYFCLIDCAKYELHKESPHCIDINVLSFDCVGFA